MHHESSRREFLRHSTAGLAAIGAAPAALLTLPTGARATPAAGNAAHALAVLAHLGQPPEPVTILEGEAATRTQPTTLGPFHRAGAPFRGKVTPPFEPGTCMVVAGRVWSLATRKPVAGATLDIWQVGLDGKYSDGNNKRAEGTKGDFRNRARLITAETGYYEFETIHPVGYNPNPDFWRSAHIHFKVAAPGCKTLVTEIFFEGDPRHEEDEIFHPALLMKVEKRTSHQHEYEAVNFEIVLESGE